ncbi:ATP-binding protein, partial [Octadecabacter sp.]|nr:ATP-binding protein [Octadecabacter sp.]
LNRLSQTLEHAIKILVAFESRVRAQEREGNGNVPRPELLELTRVRFQDGILEVAAIAERYRLQIENELGKNVADLSSVHSRIRLMNLIAPIPLLGIMVLLGWALINGYSRRTELVNDVLLGKRKELDEDFFAQRDELSELGRVALHFSEQQELLRNSQLETKNLVADLSNLIDRANSAVFAFDAEGRVTIWNKCVAELTGIKNTNDSNPIYASDIITTEDLEAFMGYIEQAKSGVAVSNVELRLLHEDKHEIPILFNLTSHLKSSGKEDEIVCIAQDLSLRNALQSEAVHASKLATLGEMSTGLAHELNQPLNAMRISLSSLKRGMNSANGSSIKTETQIDRIDEQITRASEIIDHMRIFGRRADEPPGHVDFHSCASRVARLSERQLMLAGIKFELELEKDLPILAHSVLIEQVILNLISNAKFELLDRKIPEPWIAIVARGTDDHVVFTIDDNAGGIPEAVIKRIFEPFYSTKEAGEGTGLGLSISYGIVEDAGGNLSAKNTDIGARFSIKLPKCSSDEFQAAS